jgi:hypothetical protein
MYIILIVMFYYKQTVEWKFLFEFTNQSSIQNITNFVGWGGGERILIFITSLSYLILQLKRFKE